MSYCRTSKHFRLTKYTTSGTQPWAQEFNHGYLVGVDATWHLFDGFATKGRMTCDPRAAGSGVTSSARQRACASPRKSGARFSICGRRDSVFESETKNVQTADETLEIAKGNAGAGLGTQLDVLQAASDVTRTRTTRLSAIYLHNAALARLARACATIPDALDFGTPM